MEHLSEKRTRHQFPTKRPAYHLSRENTDSSLRSWNLCDVNLLNEEVGYCHEFFCAFLTLLGPRNAFNQYLFYPTLLTMPNIFMFSLFCNGGICVHFVSFSVFRNERQACIQPDILISFKCYINFKMLRKLPFATSSLTWIHILLNWLRITAYSQYIIQHMHFMIHGGYIIKCICWMVHWLLDGIS